MFSEQTGVGRAEGTPGLTPTPHPHPPDTARRKRSLIFLVDELSASLGGGEREGRRGAHTPPRLSAALEAPLPALMGGCHLPTPLGDPPPAGLGKSAISWPLFLRGPGCLYPALTSPPAPLPAFLQTGSALWCLPGIAANEGGTGWGAGQYPPITLDTEVTTRGH